MALLAGSATSADAQVLKTREGGVLVIPGSLTNSGKGMLAVGSYEEPRSKGMKKESGYDDDDLEGVHITIYDTKMNKQTEFDFTLPTVTYTCWKEQAVTSYKMNDLFVVRDEQKNYMTEVTGVTTNQELVNWLNQNWGGGYEIFKDANDVEYVIYGRYYDDTFFNYWELGASIVRRYYKVENGLLYEVYRYIDYNYEVMNNLYSTSWNYQKVGDSWTERADFELAEFDVFDLDKGDGAYDRESQVISQNLFNNDDKWEFVLIPDGVEFVVRDGFQTTDDGYIYLERYQTTSDGDFDMMVINQDGTVLNKIKFDGLMDEEDFTVLRMDGKTYLKVVIEDEDYDDWDCLYLYDNLGNGVQKVASGRVKVSPTIVNRGENVDVELDAKAKNSSVTVTSADGKILMVQPVSDHNQMRIDTSRLSKGIYNVTVREQGKAHKTERFMVK